MQTTYTRRQSKRRNNRTCIRIRLNQTEKLFINFHDGFLTAAKKKKKRSLFEMVMFKQKKMRFFLLLFNYKAQKLWKYIRRSKENAFSKNSLNFDKVIVFFFFANDWSVCSITRLFSALLVFLVVFFFLTLSSPFYPVSHPNFNIQISETLNFCQLTNVSSLSNRYLEYQVYFCNNDSNNSNNRRTRNWKIN